MVFCMFVVYYNKKTLYVVRMRNKKDKKAYYQIFFALDNSSKMWEIENKNEQ